MKNLIFTLVLSVMCYFVHAQPYNVTISVDMTSYSGSAYDAVVMGGGINGWSGAITLTNEPGTNIWSTTVQKEGWIDYRFEVNGGVVGWNCEFRNEDTGTEGTGVGSCFTNPWEGTQTNVHWFEVTSDVVIETVCWESCSACVTTLKKEIIKDEVEIYVSGSKSLVLKGLGEGNLKISVYDIQGKLWVSEMLQTEGNEITSDCTKSLSKGVYIIKVENANSQIVRKLMLN